jgi:hypothetical protein
LTTYSAQSQTVKLKLDAKEAEVTGYYTALYTLNQALEKATEAKES